MRSVKKKWIVSILLAALMLLALGACQAPYSLADAERDNRDKWRVTYDLQGGMFNSSKGITISHYYPQTQGGTLIVDPTSGAFTNVKIERSSYVFEGWYPNADFNYAERWDFKENKITGDTVLYAHWLERFEFRFLYQATEGGEWTEIPETARPVSQGATLQTSYQPSREGYTLIDWFEDEACTIPCSDKTAHPGKIVEGDNSTTRIMNIYTNWRAGDWAVVKTANDLWSAIRDNRNIYLYRDIDDFGELDLLTESNWETPNESYDKTFDGNGFSVKNVVLSCPKGALREGYDSYCGLFKTLGSGAKLNNVSFEISLDVAPDAVRGTPTCGLLASTIEKGVTFTGVTLSGTFTVTHEAGLTDYNFGLVGGAIQEGTSLVGLNFTGAELKHQYTGEGTYTNEVTDLGLIYFTKE